MCAAANAFRRVLSSCSACTYMYPGHLGPLAVGDAHVRTGGGHLAANLDDHPVVSTPGLFSRPAYRMHICLSKEPLCSLSCLFPLMARVTPARPAARIPRAVHYRITVEISRKSHELHASSSSSDEPEPSDKTALSMLVPLPSLSRRGESTTAWWPRSGQTTLHISLLPRHHDSIPNIRNRSVTTLFVLTPGGGEVSGRAAARLLLLQDRQTALERSR